MARSINSPGVQITEKDLSQYQQIVGGTTVLVPGYAPQGPTDEVLLVTSISELEQIYGTPTTPAERYFYYSCKQILNSPATLLTTRLPYGSGMGEGFADQYSALLFPVASANNVITLGQPTYKTLTENEYEDLTTGNYTWSTLSPGTSSVTLIPTASSVDVPSALSAAFIQNLSAVDPTPDSYGLYFIDNNNVRVTFEVNLSSINYGSGGPASFVGGILNAGLVVVNKSKTSVNELFEGYYVSLTDNSEWGLGSDFTAVTKFYGLSSREGVVEVPQSRLTFALSGTNALAGADSVSETIERRYNYDVGQPYYNDTVVLNLFKVRRSSYEPQDLTIAGIESFIGSLDADKQTIAANAGDKSFYLETVVNNGSPNLKVLVNNNISEGINWTSPGSGTDAPVVSVRTTSSARALFPNSVFVPTYQATTDKDVGRVRSKLERALTLVESPEAVPLDVIIDAGISTIAVNTPDERYYSDSKFYPINNLSNSSSPEVQTYRSTISIFNNFVEKVRRDCVFIADPLRQILLNGADAKTLDYRSNTFTQNVYNPLKVMFEVPNSNYSITYGNWVKVYDKFTDKNFWMPFSGHAAAVFARTDTFAQPWIAPAGLTRGILNEVLDLAINPNQKQRDFLYSISINPVVFFSGDGYVIFGQKTLQKKPSAFDRINVRRLFLVLERATQGALKYFVFEPNTEFTRTRLKNTITPVLELAKNTEGIYDYIVVCDERNNTPDVIDRNELAVDIYIKPVKAAEFILVNFIATRTGQNFQELI